MANPSLQIGDSNWAIKEDNLLGYSTAGTRFVPEPITMTRATLGTRVNPSGLVEDVALLGGEIANNNTIQNSNGGVISETSSLNYNVVSDGTAATTFLPRITFDGTTNGKTYKLVITPSNQSGDIDLKLYNGSSFEFQDNDMSSELVYYFTTNGTPFIAWAGQQTFSVDFTISVKEATIDNLPRVDYTDGTSSLLVEPQRTNLITYSSDFSGWTLGSNSTLTYESDVVAPDGSLGVYRLTNPATYSTFIQSPSFSSSNPLTVSLYVKSTGSGNDNFNFYTGATNVSDLKTATSEWQRFDYTADGSSMYIVNDGDTFTSDIYIWGGQAEVGSYPTSLIPTSGSTVTRNQETYTKTGISDKINSEEGVLYAEIAGLVDDDSTSNSYHRVISISDNSTTNRVELKAINNGTLEFRFDSSSSDIRLTHASFDFTIFNKIALVWESGRCAAYLNGVKVVEDLTFSTFSSNVLHELSFDSPYNGGSNLFYGKCKALAVYKTALSDSELVTLTT